MVLLYPFASFGQDSISVSRPLFSHSITFGYGSRTTDYLLDGFHPGHPTVFDYNNKTNPGALSLSYAYRVTRIVCIGVAATVEQENRDWLDNEVPYNNAYGLQTSAVGQFVRTAYTIAIEASFDYVNAGILRLYAVVGLGRTFEHETDQYYPAYYNSGYYNGINNYGPMRQTIDKSHTNFYFSPLGMSIGNRLGGFFEVGFGYKGVFHTGLSYNFGQK